MSDVIDFAKERDKREGPDAEFVCTDGFGRPMYMFHLQYAMDDGDYCTDVWAYSNEDAEKRVTAMRESLVVLGQVYAGFPA